MKHTAYYVKYPDTDNKTCYRGPFSDVFAAYIDMQQRGDNIVIERVVTETIVDFKKEKIKLDMKHKDIQRKIGILNNDFPLIKESI